MTGDSHTPEPAPRKPTNGPQSAEDPTVGISGGARGASGPQAGAESLDPREVIRDAIATTLNAGSYWLPIDGQRAIADALVSQLADGQPATGTHQYLSTGCLHGQHDYCQNKTGLAGPKQPAQCKFCAAPCRCACHTTKEQP